ncbi:MAG: hypothetical protein OXB95_00290 [Rhodobacteraceae bacterium]|nr:hypothetical protein [Paracoccaceae bacterium]
MALRDADMPSLLDAANRTDPKGAVAAVAEILQKDNPILLDMLFIECSRGSSHMTGVRVRPSKSTSFPKVFNTGMVQSFSEIPAARIQLRNKTAAYYRLPEELAAIKEMNQKFAETIFYGDEAKSPAQFTGLSQYYNDLSAENATQIIDAKGTGSNLRSIWIVTWGESTCHGIYPKGTPAGLQIDDLGTTQLVSGGGTTTANWKFFGSHYQWNLGLVLRDSRFLVRIANIDIDEITDAAASGPNLVRLITNGLFRLKNMYRGLVAIYMCREIHKAIYIQQIEAKENSTLTQMQLYRKGVCNLTCGGVPLYMTDSLDVPESRVT